MNARSAGLLDLGDYRGSFANRDGSVVLAVVLSLGFNFEEVVLFLRAS